MSFGDFNRTESGVRNFDTTKLQDRIVEALEFEQPQIKSNLLKACIPATELELNIALDRAQTADQIVRRVCAGRIEFHLPDWEPARPARQPPRASGPITQAPKVAAANEVQPGKPKLNERVLAWMAAQPHAVKSQEIADGCGLTQQQVRDALKSLMAKKRVVLDGRGPSARWACIRPSPIDPARSAAHESQPSLSQRVPPAEAAQAQVAENGASSEAVPAGESGSETEPSRSRKEPFIPVANVDAKVAFNEARAVAESSKRTQGEVVLTEPSDRWKLSRMAQMHAGEPAYEGLDELGDFLAGGEAPASIPRTAAEDAIAVLSDRCLAALWSDGSLQIDAGDVNLTLTPAATRVLIDYLDRVCAIDMH